MTFMNFLIKKIKGLNNTLPLHDLANIEFFGRTGVTETFLSEAENIDITDLFHPRRRQGYDKKVDGNIHSLWSNEDICIFRQGTYLKRLYPDYTTTVLRSDLVNAKIRMSYVDILGNIFYSDGIQSGVVEGGISRLLGIVPPQLPNVSLVSGGIPAGEYKITLTYVKESGQESGALYPLRVIVNSPSSIVLSNIQASENPLVRYINIYFGASNKMFLYTTISNENSSYTIKSKNVKSKRLMTLGLSPMPMGDILEYYNGKLYSVMGDVCWCSEPFSFELCNLETNYFKIGSPIFLLSSVKDGLWVATNKNTFFARGDGIPFKFTEKATYGAIKGTQLKISGESIGKGIDDKISIWSSSDGICAGLDNGVFNNLTYDIFGLPNSLEGASLYRKSRGINQFITSLRNPESSTEIYQ